MKKTIVDSLLYVVLGAAICFTFTFAFGDVGARKYAMSEECVASFVHEVEGAARERSLGYLLDVPSESLTIYMSGRTLSYRLRMKRMFLYGWEAFSCLIG